MFCPFLFFARLNQINHGNKTVSFPKCFYCYFCLGICVITESQSRLRSWSQSSRSHAIFTLYIQQQRQSRRERPFGEDVDQLGRRWRHFPPFLPLVSVSSLSPPPPPQRPASCYSVHFPAITAPNARPETFVLLVWVWSASILLVIVVTFLVFLWSVT